MYIDNFYSDNWVTLIKLLIEDIQPQLQSNVNIAVVISQTDRFSAKSWQRCFGSTLIEQLSIM